MIQDSKEVYDDVLREGDFLKVEVNNSVDFAPVWLQVRDMNKEAAVRLNKDDAQRIVSVLTSTTGRDTLQCRARETDKIVFDADSKVISVEAVQGTTRAFAFLSREDGAALAEQLIDEPEEENRVYCLIDDRDYIEVSLANNGRLEVYVKAVSDDQDTLVYLTAEDAREFASTLANMREGTFHCAVESSDTIEVTSNVIYDVKVVGTFSATDDRAVILLSKERAQKLADIILGLLPGEPEPEFPAVLSSFDGAELGAKVVPTSESGLQPLIHTKATYAERAPVWTSSTPEAFVRWFASVANEINKLPNIEVTLILETITEEETLTTEKVLKSEMLA